MSFRIPLLTEVFVIREAPEAQPVKFAQLTPRQREGLELAIQADRNVPPSLDTSCYSFHKEDGKLHAVIDPQQEDAAIATGLNDGSVPADLVWDPVQTDPETGSKGTWVPSEE